MLRRPLYAGGVVALVVGALLLVLGFTSGRGEAFDEEASRLTGATGPELVLPPIGLATPLVGGGVSPSGTINPPAGQAMWVQGYDRVRPGSVGTAVVAGHIEHSGKPDIFAHLPSVRVGDELHLVAGSVTLDFVVQRADVVDKRELTSDDDVWGENTSSRRLVLITCDDELGFGKDGHRLANYVVVAEAA